jgi:hypothetical protein
MRLSLAAKLGSAQLTKRPTLTGQRISFASRENWTWLVDNVSSFVSETEEESHHA